MRKLFNKKGILSILLLIALLIIIPLIIFLIFFLDKNQKLPIPEQEIKKVIYKENQKYSEFAKNYLGAPKLDNKAKQNLVSGILNGNNGVNEINVETAAGPLVVKITNSTLLEELAIFTHYVNNATDAATLKVNRVYTLDEFIKEVPDGGFLKITYTTKNDINTAIEIDYIK